MAYVDVVVVHPNGKEYDAEVEDDSEYKELLATLVEMLELPLADNGREIEYRLTIAGATKIQRGAVIRVEKVGPPTVRKLKPR